MGIWREVDIELTGSVSVRYPQVATVLSSLDLAHLTIMAELSNFSPEKVNGYLNACIHEQLRHRGKNNK